SDVCSSDLDLSDDPELVQNIKETYSMYPVYFTDKINVNEDLLPIFKNKLSVLAGQSGVGKSTLINTILPEAALITDEISDKLNRGRHTTRHVELIEISGGLIADPPGVSTIGSSAIDKYELLFYRADVNEDSDQCKCKECLHIQHPKWGGKAAVASAELAQSRDDSYSQILEEIDSSQESY